MEDCRLKNPGRVGWVKKSGGSKSRGRGVKKSGGQKSQVHTNLKRNVF